MQNINEKISWKAQWRISKFRDPDNMIAAMLQQGAKIEDVARQFPESFLGEERFEGNIALNEGLQALINMLAGLATVTAWNNANARLGVGDSNAAEDASQTGLQGTNKTFKAMDTGYPTRTPQTCEWRATFGASDANYHWYEFTVVNATDDTGQNLNRKVADKGTKASGETWTLSLQITFS
jgi:hypothetical protein